MKDLTLSISGMSCQHCVKAVLQALSSLPGVKPVRVDIGQALVTYDPALIHPDAIAEAITEEGYDVQNG